MRERFKITSTTFWSTPQGSEGYYGQIKFRDQDGQGITCFSFDRNDFFKYEEGMEFKLVPVSNKLDAKDPIDQFSVLRFMIEDLSKKLDKEIEEARSYTDDVGQDLFSLEGDIRSLWDRLSYLEGDVRSMEFDINNLK